VINIKIKLDSVEEVIDLVKRTSKLTYDTNFTNGRCFVDAKSILGVLGSDFSEVCNLIILADERDKNIDDFIDSIKDNIISLEV